MAYRPNPEDQGWLSCKERFLEVIAKWLERGIQLEGVEHAGQQAGANGAQGFGYERLAREASEQVIPIEGWRGR